MTKYIRYCLMVFTLALVYIGLILHNFNLILCGIFLLWIHNMCFSFARLKNRMPFLILHLTIFFFLISKPAICLLKGEKWWNFPEESVTFALLAIEMSMLFLFVGALIGEKMLERSPHRLANTTNHYSMEFNKNLQIISLLLYSICLVCFFLVEIEKLVFISTHSYTDYYSGFVSTQPYVVSVIAAIMPYVLCVFLSTLPSKQLAFIPLALYLVSAFPMLIVGVRNPVALNALLIFLYYFMRDQMIQPSEAPWIGRAEKTIIIMAIPAIIIVFALWGSIRNSVSLENVDVGKQIYDLFYWSGMSFDVLCVGFGTLPFLPTGAMRNYTFGGVIDYITHGTIAQSFFGAEALGGVNSVKMAIESNNFSHNMSYIAMGDRYLKGEGLGSSYLLETYADWGYLGIILFSLLLGILLVYVLDLTKRNWFLSTLTWISLTTVFFIPRATATGWLEFIITMRFVLVVGLCYLGASLCVKKQSLYSDDAKLFYSNNRKEVL